VERHAVRRTGRNRRRHWILFASSAVVLAALPVVSPAAKALPTGATTIPRCTARQLQIMVAPDGPRNAYGAVFLSDVASRDCSLAGQPALRVFDQSGRELNRGEALYRWTPSLPRPTSPIVLTGTAAKSNGVSAVVEFDWCGFGGGNKRFDIDFAGSKKPFVVRSVVEAPAQGFVSPACPTSSTNQLTVDYVRAIGAKGIVGLSHTVQVSPSTSLHDGERVRVSVTGFWPGGKFWLSECSTANYYRSKTYCGGQLAAQPFGMASDTGAGSYAFTVHSTAVSNLRGSHGVTCESQCVLVATSGDGLTSYARLSFASH
jgi:neocarzinostatin family protein